MVVENDVTSSPQKKLVRMQQGRGLPGGEKEDENASGRSNPVFASVSATFPSSSSAGNANSYSYGYPIDENDHRYVGLVNQAMTCYLNSLVQSLYMTPEFRNAMYEWEYISSGKNIAQKKGESSIPCQLQKLFLLLQTTENESLETRDLTQSFGWSASEAYDQHDVQELCRLMFDALEHKWKGTKHEKLIQDLYRGTMEDVVKCLACGKENVRTDYFLDLPLAVKPFGATTAFKSVQEALHAFIQPELLDGSNQYMCENCKSKQDAHKGLRITQFPYLLTIQLKRFDFDYNTMHRIKLNDKMSFPDVLDLNDYIYPPAAGNGNGNGAENGKEKKKKGGEGGEGISIGRKIGGNEENQEAEEDKMEFGSPPSKAHKPEAESPEFEPDLVDENVYEHHENGAVRVGQRIDQKSVEELLQKGENVYELFSVMVHSGSAAGGHYYAYIKNLEQDKWYSFNDTRVEFANVAEIERSFGGHSGGWNASNTNAYMLMYRKIDRKRNCLFLHTDKLPAHIQNLQAKWRQQEKEEEEHRKLQESMLTVRVRLNYPLPSIVKNQKGENLDVLKYKRQIVDDFVEYVTEISRFQTISTVFNQALDFFTERAKSYGLTISRNTSRMIFYEKNTLRRIFASKADMEKKLRCVFDPQMVEPHPLYVIRFLLDSRIASVPFPIEPPGGILLQIQRVDIAKRTTVPELCVYIPPGERVLRTKLIVGQQFRDDQREVLAARLVLESKTKENEFVNLDGGNMNGKILSDLIREYVGYSTAIVYYDGGLRQMCSTETIEATEADRKLAFEKSTMFEILDRKYFATILNVRLPSQEEISRAASVSGAYHGPTWAETVGASAIYEEREDVVQEGEENEMRIDLSGVGIPKEDNEEIPSGRASTVSMGSDDLTGGLVSGSFCNNTPQMSPSVSENEYGCGERGEISSFELKNQLNAEMTIDYVYNSHDNHNYLRLNESTNYDSRKGDLESLSSGGQSTLVPTASSIIASSSSSTGDGRIIVVSANETHRVLDIDSRLKVHELKKWISTQLNIDTSQFVIFINSSESCDRGYESHAKDDESVPNAFQSSTISVKLRPPLKIDEKMIQIVQFDMNEHVREKWKTLFEVPASQKSLIGDIMLQCLRMYKEIYGVELTPQQVRIRDLPVYMNNHIGGVLSPNQTLDERGTWNTTLYFQIISDENLFGKPGVPLLVRRFRPSTVEVSPTHEIMVNPKAENQVLSFFEGISKYSQIPVDRIAVTDLKSYGWTKWPYWKNRLELLEGSMFVKDLHKAGEKDYIERVGVRVIYYKDSEEVAKILSEEERKQIKIKENGQVESANRRKERPLRIQMSSVSEA